MRLHLPLVTTPASTMDLGHQRWHLSAGHLWYGDFSFPHRVFNGSSEQRVHVMVDVRPSLAMKGLLSPSYKREASRRSAARTLASGVFDLSERFHAEGRYAAAFRRERDAAQREGRAFNPSRVGILKAGPN
jgi:hypothetical protein